MASEGDLYLRIRALFPKQPLSPMHLLALVGRNGIGRLGFDLPGASAAPARPPTLTRDTLRTTRWSPAVFDELARAHLGTGAGIAGVQPKVMVPDRPAIPIPTLALTLSVMLGNGDAHLKNFGGLYRFDRWDAGSLGLAHDRSTAR